MIPFLFCSTFTYRFAKDAELSGSMKLKLWVSASKGSDMDLKKGVKSPFDFCEVLIYRFANIWYIL